MRLYEIRKGQGPGKLDRETFGKRFKEKFADPNFDTERDAIERLEAIAWRNYQESRKAPKTVKAGVGFSDPTYELSTEWLETRRKLDAAREQHADPSRPMRVLVVCGSARNDDTCPAELSKSWRLAAIAKEVLANEGAEVDLLDLSLLTSEYGHQIHPCKGCVATAMPLCHWPCSCYPNHSLGQIHDAMADIYERFVLAHAVLIVTPVYWFMAPSPLKLMIDRLVCADGGNPDPTTTHGKKPEEAKDLELGGWEYPQHLEGRTYALVVHGDVAGAEGVRRALADWLDGNGFIDAGPATRLDRYIGYYEPYATSHEALDEDEDLQEEVRIVAKALANATQDVRSGRLRKSDRGMKQPRPK